MNREEFPNGQEGQGSGELVLDFEDQARTAQLEAKLQEYRSRYEANIRKAESEGGLPMDYDTQAKMELLEKLLTEKKVNIEAWILEIGHRFPARQTLDNAAGVIRSYVETGGKEVKGGTGLPNIELNK